MSRNEGPDLGSIISFIIFVFIVCGMLGVYAYGASHYGK